MFPRRHTKYKSESSEFNDQGRGRQQSTFF